MISSFAYRAALALRIHIRMATGPVTTQPKGIDNIFGLAENERVINVYECDDTCLGSGPKYNVTLTNARLIQRTLHKSCCCQCGTNDHMLFISDISSMSGSSSANSCNCLQLPPIFWVFPCLLCLYVCCSCRKSINISVHGPFGTQGFTVPMASAANALSEIPKAALPHKVSKH